MPTDVAMIGVGHNALLGDAGSVRTYARGDRRRTNGGSALGLVEMYFAIALAESAPAVGEIHLRPHYEATAGAAKYISISDPHFLPVDPLRELREGHLLG